MSTNQSDYMLDKKPIVLDEDAVHEGEPWSASEVVEVEAKGADARRAQAAAF
jgi:hypothetical protein